MPHEELIFDPNGLYILLTDIGAELQFHWGFYLATAPKEGWIFHLINNEDTNHEWKYQTKPSVNVPSSLNLLVAVKIAVLEPGLHAPFGDRLAQIPIAPSPLYGPITCRTWLKEALFHLDNEGYIKLIKSVDAVEDEALMEAANNQPRRRRTAIRSTGSAA
ncbi:hypothetical protein FQN54_008804 [Arachnomyces sp. PD_36]|nr:hypothetical protein FQN54_008804 [Arachnomyces sp. PD_36]